ncbi:MAG: hypothetical protein A2X78_01565 [Gammaproteobacteria bacterium GWE2_37_16]|nr:MAG: hypothetical protein A2X78_01565 [Gammaproteobacteria bacterium GWE2_37_16]
MKHYLFIFLIMITTCCFAKSDDSALINLPADYLTRNDSTTYQKIEQPSSKQEITNTKLSEEDWNAIEGFIMFLGICAGFMFGFYKFAKKLQVKYENEEAEEKFYTCKHKKIKSPDYCTGKHKTGFQESTCSHRNAGGYRGINPASGLPLRSSGRDVAGNPIGSNYTSPSYTGYRSNNK